jgi:glucose-1-phosphate cytidylyltransferase
MIEIGGKPILWHIMKTYSHHGINEFIICCGYKGYVIKEYFANYFLHQSDITFHMSENRMEVHNKRVEPWTVTLVDTGENVQTGGRLKAISEYVKNDDIFCMTYGDGVSNVDISSQIDFHKQHGKLATITSVIPPGRFGALDIKDNTVNGFMEKPAGDGGKVNGGFFILSPEVLNRISGSETVWEQEPLIGLAKEGQLISYEHKSYWQPMDTLRDKTLLEKLWNDKKAPWKVW